MSENTLQRKKQLWWGYLSPNGMLVVKRWDKLEFRNLLDSDKFQYVVTKFQSKNRDFAISYIKEQIDEVKSWEVTEQLLERD